MRSLSLLFVPLLLAGCTEPKPNTAPPPGDVSNFDPIATYGAMAAYAGAEPRLVSLSARFVRPDGTLDLGAPYNPTVNVEFVTKATNADVAGQGERAPGSGFSAGADITVDVGVLTPRLISSKSSMSGEKTWKHLGMQRRPETLRRPGARFAPPPTCKLADLWKAAIGRGAPSDVVAIIQYDADGYTFEANGQDFKLAFGADCQPKSSK